MSKSDKIGEFDKLSFINVEWMKKKGLSGMKIVTAGDKLPRNIKIMVVNSLLRDLKAGVQIDDRR